MGVGLGLGLGLAEPHASSPPPSIAALAASAADGTAGSAARPLVDGPAAAVRGRFAPRVPAASPAGRGAAPPSSKNPAGTPPAAVAGSAAAARKERPGGGPVGRGARAGGGGGRRVALGGGAPTGPGRVEEARREGAARRPGGRPLQARGGGAGRRRGGLGWAASGAALGSRGRGGRGGRGGLGTARSGGPPRAGGPCERPPAGDSPCSSSARAGTWTACPGLAPWRPGIGPANRTSSPRVSPRVSHSLFGNRACRRAERGDGDPGPRVTARLAGRVQPAPSKGEGSSPSLGGDDRGCCPRGGFSPRRFTQPGPRRARCAPARGSIGDNLIDPRKFTGLSSGIECSGVANGVGLSAGYRAR